MSKAFDTRKLVLLGLLTAIVVVLQLLGAFIKFGPFSISLVLLPIAIGAALISPLAGGWLGLVFGGVVLASGDAALFLAVDPLGTVLVVLLKGMLAGLAAGAVYRLLDRILKSGIKKTISAVAAAVVCPIVNTGIFLIGSYIFFMPTLRVWAAGAEAEAAGFSDATEWVVSQGFATVSEWAASSDGSAIVVTFIFIGLVGLNFLVEMGLNILLSPTIVRLIQYGQDKRGIINPGG